MPDSEAQPRLTFGIYPGGAAGSVARSGPARPEDPALRLAALERLRSPGRPFVLHLYVGYTGPGGYSARDQIGTELAAYAAAGFQTEVAICYRPAGGGSDADVAGFVAFVRTTVESFARDPGFVSVQVTNEANVGGAPDACDGAYLGARDALIDGVIAAHEVVQANRFSGVRVGFNWAYSTEQDQEVFWRYLGRTGGPRFTGALDWVGLDAYPFTWNSPDPPASSDELAVATARWMDRALSLLRSTYLPFAGIPDTVSLQLSENGYPTGPGRTDAMQATVLRAAVTAVHQARRADNVTGYRWFDLRDADSSGPSFESGYGIMRDDYSPKPAFAVYRQLVAEFGAR
ncbi:MAG TPA: hypothetical protein VIH85_17210 [Solirubrobacteraceae bacterium]